MKYSERKNYTYDPEIFKRRDTQTALKIHDEYVYRHSGQPHSKFFEVDRGPGSFDPVWNTPVSGTTKYSRTIELPSIVQFDKLDWKLARQGRAAKQRWRLWVSNLGLQKADYFPTPGDRIYHSGYLTEITAIDFEPNSYWQQTNVWLGLIVIAEIVPDGDAQPLTDPSTVPPAQVGKQGLQEIPAKSGSIPAIQNGPDIEAIMPAAVIQPTRHV